MLEVVEYQQRIPPIEPLNNLIENRQIAARPHTEGLRDLRKHERGIGDAGQIDEPAPVIESWGSQRGVQRQAGFPDPAGANEREQTNPAPSQLLMDGGGFGGASDE
jgi:hypothetical protein